MEARDPYKYEKVWVINHSIIYGYMQYKRKHKYNQLTRQILKSDP